MGALDFNLGCSGYVYGLSLAKGLIAGGIAQNVLLITSKLTVNTYIHVIKVTVQFLVILLRQHLFRPFAEIGNFSLGTDGRGAENLIVKKGAMRQANALNDLQFDKGGNPKSSDFLFMNGGEIFNLLRSRTLFGCRCVE